MADSECGARRGRSPDTPLLSDTLELPQGLLYRPDFLAAAEEAALVATAAALPLHEAKFRSYLAKRRVAHFHTEPDAPYYEEGEGDDASGTALPPAIVALRARVAAVVGVSPEAFVHALVSEYRPGTPIGWHRDKPVYGVVAGVSLAGTGTMRWRPYAAQDARHTLSLELAPRSLYVMRDAIRWEWQHSMPPMKMLRYSITLRTRAGVR
jgi:alkylated DNA repair dioxygenase AlkB